MNTFASLAVDIVDNLGERRVLGNLQPKLFGSGNWPVYGDFPETPMIPRSKWKPVSYNHFFPPVKDQDGIGACNAFAAVNTLQACRNVVGLPDVNISCGYLYGSINGQRDQGSMLEDALQWLVEHGSPPSSVVGDLEWKKSQWPPSVADEAKPYKIFKAFWCPTFEHLASATQCGFFTDVGIMWADGDNIDSDGWIPNSPRGNVGGHAIARGSLEYRDGKWGLGGPNSWSTRWGKDGYMVIPEPRFSNAVGGHWACLVSKDDDGKDVPPLVS